MCSLNSRWTIFSVRYCLYRLFLFYFWPQHRHTAGNISQCGLNSIPGIVIYKDFGKMTRGNQREIDRARAAARHGNKGEAKEGDFLKRKVPVFFRKLLLTILINTIILSIPVGE